MVVLKVPHQIYTHNRYGTNKGESHPCAKSVFVGCIYVSNRYLRVEVDSLDGYWCKKERGSYPNLSRNDSPSKERRRFRVASTTDSEERWNKDDCTTAPPPSFAISSGEFATS